MAVRVADDELGARGVRAHVADGVERAADEPLQVDGLDARAHPPARDAAAEDGREPDGEASMVELVGDMRARHARARRCPGEAVRRGWVTVGDRAPGTPGSAVGVPVAARARLG